MKKLFLCVLIISSSGCWTTKKTACETWLASGEVASSYEHCIQCAATFGTGDLRSVRDCAFKKEIGQVRDGF